MTIEERARVIENLIVVKWRNLHDAAIYLGKGYRFLLAEVHRGRLKAARVGGRREMLTCRERCDHYVKAATEMQIVPVRRRARTRW